MSDVLIRNIPEDTLSRLKQRAERNRRSLQQELHEVITRAAEDDIGELIDRIHERRAEYEISGKAFEDSAKLIRRDRSR